MHHPKTYCTLHKICARFWVMYTQMCPETEKIRITYIDKTSRNHSLRERRKRNTTFPPVLIRSSSLASLQKAS